MKKIHKMFSGGYYMIESKATARSCYFENEEEIGKFKRLFERYLGKYFEIQKMYLSSEGYQILVRVGEESHLRSLYKKRIGKLGRQARDLFLKETWRIVSEQMRIFHSVYAKWVNVDRERSGGLVKERYSRYYFESELEFLRYDDEMEKGKEVRSQERARYRVSERWILGVRWEVIRGGEWVRSLMNRGFQNYVVQDLVNFTISSHNPNSQPPPPPKSP